jgi:glycosyltransferase involved in cell wall biosynthesis
MKIVVNVRFLLNGKLEGIGWFTYETIQRIVIQHPEHEFYFLFDRPYDRKFIFSSNVKPIVLFPPARHPVLWYWWFEIAVKKTLKKINPDIFISPDGFLPLGPGFRSLAVIHDLNFEHYPEKLRWLVKKYLLYCFPKFAQRADRIVTVSNYSKQDIVSRYNIDPKKIDVAYNGANSIYRPLTREEKNAAKKQFAGGNDYFIYIGALLPRKNVSRMLEAFDIFKSTDKSDVKMLIVGANMFNTGDIEKTYQKMKYRDDVLFTGHLAAGTIELALGGALSLVYVSYFEGFGIPLVEAMYADVPVITSNVTSMPEVAGKAALIIDPFSVESIAKALHLMYADPNLRESLIEQGRQQRLKFSWDKTADQLWRSIEKCISDKKP